MEEGKMARRVCLRRLALLAKISAIGHVINDLAYGDDTPHSMQDVVAITNRGLPKQLDAATTWDKMTYDAVQRQVTYRYLIDQSKSSLKSWDDAKRGAAQSVCGQLLDNSRVTKVRYEYWLTSPGTISAFEITQKDCP